MASADFSLRRLAPSAVPASPFQALGETSQGKARDLRSIYPPHLRLPLRMTVGFGFYGTLAQR